MRAAHTQDRLAVKHDSYIILAQHIDRPIGAHSDPEIDREKYAHVVCTMANRYGIDRTSARRLVACWNACNGISTERLEDLGRPLMAHLIGCDERAARMVQERGELLAALRESLAALEFAVEQGGGPACEHESGGAVCFCKENKAINSARAAIAKVDGEQP